MKQRGITWTIVVTLIVIVSGCGLVRKTPPTLTPIYITATSVPPVIPIIATETPAQTPVLPSTEVGLLPTQAPSRTITPTPLPPITMTPSFTVTTTNTPARSGAATFAPVGGRYAGAPETNRCANPPGVFGRVYQNDATLAEAVGCPLVKTASVTSSAYQTFQNGLMIWVSPSGQQPQSMIYVLFNNGTYQRFNDTFQDGVDPQSTGAVPPEGHLEPVRGFGKVWRDNAGVRDTLGWALSGENGGSAQTLKFERGEMLYLSQAGQTYVLITGAPGTWRARSG